MGTRETVATVRKETPIIFWGVVAIVAILLFTVLNPIVIIPAGHRGVILTFSKVTGVMDEGIGLRVPFVQSVRKVEVRTVKYEVESSAASKDIQTVTSHIALNYHINPKGVGDLYTNVGDSFENNIISPAIQEAVKANTAKYVAQELIEKREQVSLGIKEMLNEKLMIWGIAIDALSIVNFNFEPEFVKAVEEKQVAQQNALKEKNILDAVEMQAKQKVAAATAEATAIRIQAQAINSSGGRDYVNLQWIRAWKDTGGKVPTVMSGSQGNAFIMNIKGMTDKD